MLFVCDIVERVDIFSFILTTLSNMNEMVSEVVYEKKRSWLA